MKSISARQIFKSFGHEWIITRIRIHSNYRNDDRIEVSARRRYYRGDEVNTYNEILSYKYADRLARDFYGKSILKFNNIVMLSNNLFFKISFTTNEILAFKFLLNNKSVFNSS